MKKFCILIAFANICFFSHAQNIGIGTANPTEKLDVAGNVNVSGVLKTNGTAGKAGQVLSMNGQGAMQWADGANGGYKNFVAFNADGPWLIPDSVTQIAIELWGGGGGGAMGGGGAAGSYKSYNNFVVIPGKTIGVIIGKGGAGASTANGFGENGGSTTFSYNNNNNYLAGGGLGAGSSMPGYNSQSALNGTNVMMVQGESGGVNGEAYSQYASGTFIRAIRHGDGGKAYGFSSVRAGLGGTSVYYLVANTISHGLFSIPASCPAAGGGGGEDGYGKYGSAGAHGLVIIHF